MTATPSWQVEGDYFEACNCNSTCPCIFLADPSQGDCKLTIAWHIEKGHYGPTRLESLNVAGVFYTPGNMVNGPKWRAALYLDERADPKQADALSAIFSGQAGGFLANVAALIGDVIGVQTVPIQFTVDSKRRRLHISTALDLEVEGVAGGDSNREPLITNPALYGAPGFDPAIARSLKYTFKDHGFEWDNSGKNAFYSRFAYSP